MYNQSIAAAYNHACIATFKRSSPNTCTQRTPCTTDTVDFHGPVFTNEMFSEFEFILRNQPKENAVFVTNFLVPRCKIRSVISATILLVTTKRQLGACHNMHATTLPLKTFKDLFVFLIIHRYLGQFFFWNTCCILAPPPPIFRCNFLCNVNISLELIAMCPERMP